MLFREVLPGILNKSSKILILLFWISILCLIFYLPLYLPGFASFLNQRKMHLKRQTFVAFSIIKIMCYYSEGNFQSSECYEQWQHYWTKYTVLQGIVITR